MLRFIQNSSLMSEKLFDFSGCKSKLSGIILMPTNIAYGIKDTFSKPKLLAKILLGVKFPIDTT